MKTNNFKVFAWWKVPEIFFFCFSHFVDFIPKIWKIAHLRYLHYTTTCTLKPDNSYFKKQHFFYDKFSLIFVWPKKLFFGLLNEYPLESLWLINTFSWSCNFGRYKLGLRIYRTTLTLSLHCICFSMQEARE